MLDITLFRDRRFSAASGAVTVTFFALSGFIFLITQYFQFIRGYGALSTGARILPVAISIASPRSSAPRSRRGSAPRSVVTTGMVLFGAAFLWISTVDVDVSYPAVIVPQMVMMGLGMGLISTPATESILLVLPPARAGVGSAVNDATRELGGTLGVAVVGSIFSSVFAGHLADGLFGRTPQVPLEQAQDSVGVAQAVAAQSPALTGAMQDAFLAGLQVSCIVIGLLCLAGALVSVFALPGRIRPPAPAYTDSSSPGSSLPVG